MLARLRHNLNADFKYFTAQCFYDCTLDLEIKTQTELIVIGFVRNNSYVLEFTLILSRERQLIE